MADNPYSQIREGMAVLDLAGDQIGTVTGVEGQETMADVGPGDEGVGRDMEAKRAGKGAAGHVVVRGGGRELYIPFSAVNEVRGNTVVIIVDKESINNQGWDRTPQTAS